MRLGISLRTRTLIVALLLFATLGGSAITAYAASTQGLVVEDLTKRISPNLVRGIKSGQEQYALVVLHDEEIFSDAEATTKAKGLDRWNSEIFGNVKNRVKSLKSLFLSHYRPNEIQVVQDHQAFPVLFIRIRTAYALAKLDKDPMVAEVYDNLERFRPMGAPQPYQTLIGQPAVQAEGYIGAGQTIVIFDSGFVDPSLFPPGTRLVDQEACYEAFDNSDATCSPCSYDTESDPDHDGDSYPDNDDLPTVTCSKGSPTPQVVPNVTNYANLDPDSELHAESVTEVAATIAPGATFAEINVGSADSNLLYGAFDWVAQNVSTYKIAAINFSGGGAPVTPPCVSAFDTPIKYMRALQVAFIASSGNDSARTQVADPACDPNAVSAGSVDSGSDQDIRCSATPGRVSGFTDYAPPTGGQLYPTLYAPGCPVVSAYGVSNAGTSFAAPVIAGAWADLAAIPYSNTLNPANNVLRIVQDTSQSVATTGITGQLLDLQSAVNEAVAQSPSGGSGGGTGGTGGGGTNPPPANLSTKVKVALLLIGYSLSQI